jgi:hypothetical protein
MARTIHSSTRVHLISGILSSKLAGSHKYASYMPYGSRMSERRSNPDVPQGSRASAKISVYGGQSGPLMDEEIDATGSAGAMEAWQASLKSAVAACGQVSITIFGVGSSTVEVAEVAVSHFGGHPSQLG